MSHADYKHFLTIPTRWMDNDIYGHVNNVVYYSWFDTVINEYLIRAGGLDITTRPLSASVGFGLHLQTKAFRFEPISAGCVSANWATARCVTRWACSVKGRCNHARAASSCTFC